MSDREVSQEKADQIASDMARMVRAQFETEVGVVVTSVVVLVAYGQHEAAFGEDSEHHFVARTLVSDYHDYLNGSGGTDEEEDD